MADTPTPWYDFALAESDDLMSDPRPYITENFQKCTKAGKCDVIAGPAQLPQTGIYEVGDKIYMTGAGLESIYVCIAKDALWGIWWKPIHAALTPWQVVPATAIRDPNYQQHPTQPYSIAIDNKARLWSRGALQIKGTASILNYTALGILENIPDGLRPPSAGLYNYTIEPVDMSNPAGVTAFKGGRMYLNAQGASNHRFMGATATTPRTTNIWMNEVKYPLGRNDFVTP